MAQLDAVLACAAAMIAVWTLVGLPLAVRTLPPALSAFAAPGLGFAVHSAAMLVLSMAFGLSRPLVVTVTVVAVAAGFGLSWRDGLFARRQRPTGLLALAVLGAALLALVPLAAILPKETADGVALAPPIFDHSKIALIDEMIRSGVPPANPFFAEIGTPDRVAYYYLWHFAAATMAVLTGVSGWEADAALTGFTAFASLLLVAGLAAAIAGRASAAVIAVALGVTGSMRPIVGWLFGTDWAYEWIGWVTGFGGWLFQVSWAPQHVAAAMFVVLACLLLAQLPQRAGALLPAVLALTVAAGFASSVWVGGITFAPTALAISLYGLLRLPPERRLGFVLRAAAAAVLAVALVAPLIRDQLQAAVLRGGGAPIAIAPVEVFGEALPDAWRPWLDPPAYWLIYLPLEFPAFYPAGLAMLALLLRRPGGIDSGRRLTVVLTVAVVVSLVVAWLLVSVVGSNNDLGWRAVLPAVLLLMSLAAAALARWLAAPARMAAALALLALMLGLPGGAAVIDSNVAPVPSAQAAAFARAPALWQAVRRHTAVNERVADDPLLFADVTPWPANMSWALMADRRSCYAGRELAIPFAAVPAVRRDAIEAQFVRVFAGKPMPGDVAALAERFRCDVVVLTPEDGAWASDPFAAGDRYRLVESTEGAWRIYRRAAARP